MDEPFRRNSVNPEETTAEPQSLENNESQTNRPTRENEQNNGMRNTHPSHATRAGRRGPSQSSMKERPAADTPEPSAGFGYATELADNRATNR